MSSTCRCNADYWIVVSTTGCIRKNATLAIFHNFKKSTRNSKIWIMSACALGHQLSNHTKHAPMVFRMTDQASFKEKCPKCDLLEVSFPFKIKPRDFSKERMKVSCARDPCGQNDTLFVITAFRMTCLEPFYRRPPTLIWRCYWAPKEKLNIAHFDKKLWLLSPNEKVSHTKKSWLQISKQKAKKLVLKP